MKSKKTLKEIAKRDANRFCRRNKVYETYDGSVADMIKKLYITTYLRARHQIMSEINQKTPEEAFENVAKAPEFKVMKSEGFRVKNSKPNIVELPVSNKDFSDFVENWKKDFELFPQKAAYYKQSWDELTALEKAISKMIGNSNFANSSYSKKYHAVIPVIRKVDDFSDIRIEDRITYIVNDNEVLVQAFNKEKKLKRYRFSKDEILNFIKERGL